MTTSLGILLFVFSLSLRLQPSVGIQIILDAKPYMCVYICLLRQYFLNFKNV